MPGFYTIAQLVAQLREVVGNRSSADLPDATCLGFFNQALLHVGEPGVYRHYELRDVTTQALATGDDDYVVAAAGGIETRAVESVVIFNPAAATQRYRLELMREREAHALRGTLTAGLPTWYSYEWGALEIVLLPAPSATYNGWTLEIRRIRTPARWAAVDATVSPLSSIWDEALLIGAAWRCWRYLKEVERAELAKAEFGQLINEIKDRARIDWEDRDFGPPLVYQRTQDLY